ncbi:Retrovirus-related Pol polyprotein from transposon 297 [Araneus ventricosus]|uniref:RNA-directed DNA polymerase n=1 Tax=Araneus ventricosus TaxID=182803 RepID=A0A4Y2JDY2_ARAVE|nr:Retrovirus-related Pol polyprotein from transposon 297 [Araneus ventricosus]
MMAELLNGGEEFAVPYLDDDAIFSNTWEEHLNHIDWVLHRIQKANLNIKPSKCKFARDYVEYLGHTIGQGSTTPGEMKSKAIRDFPAPPTKTEIRAFLGLAGYYRQYVPMFSIIAAPLTDLLKGRSKKGEVIWSAECTAAFEKLKTLLTSEPVLYAPDFTKKIRVAD